MWPDSPVVMPVPTHLQSCEGEQLTTCLPQTHASPTNALQSQSRFQQPAHAATAAAAAAELADLGRLWLPVVLGRACSQWWRVALCSCAADCCCCRRKCPCLGLSSRRVAAPKGHPSPVWAAYRFHGQTAINCG